MPEYEMFDYEMPEYQLPEYKKSEYVELQDKFYFCKHHQQALERELEEKEFQCKCMPKNKVYYSSEMKRDVQVLVCSGAIVMVIVYFAVDCIINKNAGSAIILLVLCCLEAKQFVHSYDLIKNILKYSRIKKRLEEEELDMRSRIYDINIELEKLKQERDKLEKAIKLHERIREIEGRLTHEDIGVL